MNFNITGRGQGVTAAAVSQTIDLGPGSEFQTDVCIFNPGPNIVHAIAGGASVAADVDCMPIPANSSFIWNKGTNRYLALLAPTGDQAVHLFTGEGS